MKVGNMTTPIKDHEGKKYLRKIYSAVDGESIEIDVYCVLDAFKITCPAIGHAVKKLLCAGIRGKGDKIADLTGAIAAINRAIELDDNRDREWAEKLVNAVLREEPCKKQQKTRKTR